MPDGTYLDASSDKLVSCLNVSSVTWDDNVDFHETVPGPPVHEDDILGIVYPTKKSLTKRTSREDTNSYY